MRRSSMSNKKGPRHNVQDIPQSVLALKGSWRLLIGRDGWSGEDFVIYVRVKTVQIAYNH